MLDELSDHLGAIVAAGRAGKGFDITDCTGAQQDMHQLEDQIEPQLAGVPRDLARKAIVSLKTAVGSCGNEIQPFFVSIAKEDVDALRSRLS